MTNRDSGAKLQCMNFYKRCSKVRGYLASIYEILCFCYWLHSYSAQKLDVARHLRKMEGFSFRLITSPDKISFFFGTYSHGYVGHPMSVPMLRVHVGGFQGSQ